MKKRPVCKTPRYPGTYLIGIGMARTSPLLLALTAACLSSASAATYSAGGHIVNVCRAGTDSLTVEVTSKNSGAVTATSTAFSWPGLPATPLHWFKCHHPGSHPPVLPSSSPLTPRQGTPQKRPKGRRRPSTLLARSLRSRATGPAGPWCLSTTTPAPPSFLSTLNPKF